MTDIITVIQAAELSARMESIILLLSFFIFFFFQETHGACVFVYALFFFMCVCVCAKVAQQLHVSSHIIFLLFILFFGLRGDLSHPLKLSTKRNYKRGEKKLFFFFNFSLLCVCCSYLYSPYARACVVLYQFQENLLRAILLFTPFPLCFRT